MSLIEPEDTRLAKCEELRRLGVDPYGAAFPGTLPARDLVERFGEREGTAVRVAGRVMTQRRMGKVVFMDLRDWTGKVQLFLRQNDLGATAWAVQEQVEPGDLVGVEGTLGKTRTGEVTVFVAGLVVLAKALMRPPEKWHGLRDVEIRYRHRSLDLFTNDEVMQVFLRRSEIVRAVRAYLHERGFVEVETPMMQAIPGGAAARPFRTHHNALDVDLYLRIAPELYLKRLLVGGMERVFEINRNFRNEGVSTQHNPEFTMLEVYQAYGDYAAMMELAEGMIARLAADVCGSAALPFGDHTIDYTPPWPRRRFWDLLEEHLGVARGDEGAVRTRAAEHQIEDAQGEHADVVAYHLFEKEVEHLLTGPVFVVEYPKSISPLAKAKADDPGVAERFELFIGGMEIAPAYTELNDPLEQERRFLEQVGTQDDRMLVDRDFLRALAHGMPPAGGMGVGIDRLAMLLTNQPSIRDVILFPLLRPTD